MTASNPRRLNPGRTILAVAILLAGLPGGAAAQFAVDTEPATLRGALRRPSLADLNEGESGVVSGPLTACMRDRALYVASGTLTAEMPSGPENYRLRRLAGNAVEIETIASGDAAPPRSKIALALVLAASERDCTAAGLAEDRLLRVALIDGAADATTLLRRVGALEPTEKPTSPAPGPARLPPDPANAWRFSEEIAEGGIHVALVARLEPRGGAANADAPRLNMRCDNGEVSLTVTSPTAEWKDRVETTVRVDDGKVATYRWRAAEDGKAAGLWTSAEALPFIEKLGNGRVLFLRLRGRDIVYAEYDLADLAGTLTRIRDACK